MQSISSAMGFGGKVSNADLKQTDKTGPVHITYDYARPEFGDWPGHRILPLFPMLEIAAIDKDKAPDYDIDQGAPRTFDATTRIQLPDGFTADLPDPVHVKRDYATFDKTYRFDKGVLEVDRKVVILKKKIAKAEWKDYYAYTKSIGMQDGETYITLLQFAAKPADKASNAPTERGQPVPPADTDAQQLMKEAVTAMQAGDPAKETALLEQIRAAHPDYAYVMSMLGVLAINAGHVDEGI